MLLPGGAHHVAASSQDGVHVVDAADGAHKRLVDALEPPFQTFCLGGRLRQRGLGDPCFVWGHRRRGIRSVVCTRCTAQPFQARQTLDKPGSLNRQRCSAFVSLAEDEQNNFSYYCCSKLVGK